MDLDYLWFQGVESVDEDPTWVVRELVDHGGEENWILVRTLYKRRKVRDLKKWEGRERNRGLIRHNIGHLQPHGLCDKK